MRFNANLANLTNYEAGKPIELVVREFGIEPKDVIKLASNENPFGTSKKVQKTIKRLSKKAHLYPDDSMFELKMALANKFGLSQKNFIIGQGSDQILEFAMHAKASKDSGVLIVGLTFSMYEIYAAHIGAKVYKTKGKFHDLNEMREVYEANKNNIGIIFLCLPNNPLGECPDAKEVEEFISAIDEDTLVVVDGAYHEFAAYKDKNKKISPKKLIAKFPNAIYLGTFSKLYGLGGMRVGYGIGDESVISELSKLRSPFNISTISLGAAITALEDREYTKKTLSNNLKQMKVFEDFASENGIEFIPSYANFITFLFKKLDGTKICDELLKQGIIIRNLKSYGLNGVRITIGRKSQNEKLLKLLKEIIK